MERLTNRNPDGSVNVKECGLHEFLEKLSAYEDTGLSPEEVHETQVELAEWNDLPEDAWKEPSRLTTRNPLTGEAVPLMFRTKDIQEAINKLCDYEDAEDKERNGRLIEFPVSNGQHLWAIQDYEVTEMEVCSLESTINGGKYVQLRRLDVMSSQTYTADQLGEQMFLSKQEAKLKLKELEEDGFDI